MKRGTILFLGWLLAASVLCARMFAAGPILPSPAEAATETSAGEPSGQSASSSQPVETGLIPEQILEGETGTIHYSYYLPEDYDPSQYPMMVVMPGYDRMWFGEDSSGSNVNWRGFLCWMERPEGIDCRFRPAHRLARNFRPAGH